VKESHNPDIEMLLFCDERYIFLTSPSEAF
jgi:hypothetical protein